GYASSVRRPARSKRIGIRPANSSAPEGNFPRETGALAGITGKLQSKHIPAPSEQHRRTDSQHEESSTGRRIVLPIETDGATNFLKCHWPLQWGGAGSATVSYVRYRSEMHFPAQPLNTPAQIDLLGIHEVSLVEASHGIEGPPADRQRGSGDPGNRAGAVV